MRRPRHRNSQLEEIIPTQKRKLLNEIHAQKKAMDKPQHARYLPPLLPANNKADAIMRSFNTGMAIFDGVMLGVKVMRKVRTYFRNLR